MKKLLLFTISVFYVSGLLAQTTLDTAINFIAKDIYGNRMELFEFLDDDKIVVIDFFNTSCGPCQTYAPDMQSSHEDFGENEGNVIFMGISKGDDNAMVAHFDSAFGITYPSISGNQGGGNAIHTQYNILGTPTVIVIKPDREITEKHIWEPTTANINDAVMNAGGIIVGNPEHFTAEVNFSVYPNPVKSSATINFISDGNHYSIRLIDLTGKEIFQKPAKYYKKGRQAIDFYKHGIPNGIYFLRLTDLNGNVINTQKLMII